MPRSVKPHPDEPRSGAQPRPRRGLLAAFWDAARIDREHAQAAFDDLNRKDPLGQRIHLALAFLAIGSLAGSTSALEIGAAPLAVCCGIRLWIVRRVWGSFFTQPAVIAAIAAALWTIASVLWSSDRSSGLDEVASVRWIWIAFALWPVIDRPRVLVAGVLCGFGVFHAGQVVQLVGIYGFDRAPERVTAWIGPAVAGSMLILPLGLYLGVAWRGTGRWRWLGLVGSALTLAGLAATGTRGAWLAAAALCALTLVLALAAIRPRTRMIRALASVGVLAVVAAGAVWIGAGDAVATRVAQARGDLSRAIESGDYDSDTGARLLMYRWAFDAVRAHPVRGLGAGSFRGWSARRAAADGLDPPPHRLHDHAHSTFPHVAAVTGLVGLALAGGFTLALLRGGWLSARTPDATGLLVGPALAVVGLLFISVFDSLHVNSQTAAVLGVLIVLCPAWRPEPR